MNRVIRRPTVTPDARAIGGGHPGALEATSVETATSFAFEEGRVAGRAEAAESVRELALAVNDAVDRAVSDLQQIRSDAVSQWVEAAIEIAEFLIDSVPEQAARSLLARMDEALAQITDSPLEIHIGATDLELVDQIFGSRSDISVIVDAGLRPGEARITGSAASADMTRSTALAAVRRALQ